MRKKYPKKALYFPRVRLYRIRGMVGAYHMFSSDSIVFFHLAAGCSVWRLFLLCLIYAKIKFKPNFQLCALTGDFTE